MNTYTFSDINTNLGINLDRCENVRGPICFAFILILFHYLSAQKSGDFIAGGKLFVESPLCSSLMLSLAISSLGKQEGGWWRKII